jgi:hypothetical protein
MVGPVRPPGDWADAQRELATRVAAGAVVPETRVRAEWWTNAETVPMPWEYTRIGRVLYNPQVPWGDLARRLSG